MSRVAYIYDKQKTLRVVLFKQGDEYKLHRFMYTSSGEFDLTVSQNSTLEEIKRILEYTVEETGRIAIVEYNPNEPIHKERVLIEESFSSKSQLLQVLDRYM